VSRRAAAWRADSAEELVPGAATLQWRVERLALVAARPAQQFAVVLEAVLPALFAAEQAHDRHRDGERLPGDQRHEPQP